MQDSEVTGFVLYFIRLVYLATVCTVYLNYWYLPSLEGKGKCCSKDIKRDNDVEDVERSFKLIPTRSKRVILIAQTI
jgi:hypothetical protein